MRSSKLFGFFGLLVALSSCSTWQEPQIDNERVEVFIPRDSLVTDIATQLFYWYHVEGASKYELQIVSPSFKRVDRLILDTNVTGDRFEFTLQPGTYEWSLRAFNNSSSTGYTVQRLIIDSTLDLSNQTILLLNPADRDTGNSLQYTFNWRDLYNVDNYRFELYSPNTSGQLVQLTDQPQNSLTYTLNTEGAYEWRVKGINGTSQTLYSLREFYVDTTAPGSSTLSSPAQNALVSSGTVSFQWTRPARTGSFTFDTLYLATDSALSNISRRLYSTQEVANLDTVSSGTYYWGVRSFDSAGNSGESGGSRRLRVQ